MIDGSESVLGDERLFGPVYDKTGRVACMAKMVILLFDAPIKQVINTSMKHPNSIHFGLLLMGAAVYFSAGCASTPSSEVGQSGTTSSPPAENVHADLPERSVIFDPAKFNRDAVVAAISEVFSAQGYKPILERPRSQQGVEFGEGTEVKRIGGEELAGPVQSVATDMQPPVVGLGSTPWFYRATVGEAKVVLAVLQAYPKGSFWAAAGVAEPAKWTPPNIETVLQQLRQRLQPLDTTGAQTANP